MKLCARMRPTVSRSDKELVSQNMTRDLYETRLTPPASYNCTQGLTSIPRGLRRGGRPHGTGLHLRDGFSSYLCRILSVEILDCFENGLVPVGDIIHPEAYIFVTKKAGKPILYNMAPIRGPTFGVCVRFPRNNRDLLTLGRKINPCERHAPCLWIGEDGYPRCTCLGVTLYNLLSEGEGFERSCCVHAEALESFLSTLFWREERDKPGSLLEKTKALAKLYLKKAPSSRTILGDSLGLLPGDVKLDMEPSRFERRWIPIRVLERNKRFFACAFCDLGTRPQCPHVSSFRTLLITGAADSALGIIEDMDGSGDAIGNSFVSDEPSTSASVVEEQSQAPEDPIFQPVIQNSDEVRVTSF